MSNYYSWTGTLKVKAITPGILAIFEVYEAEVMSPDTIYIANIAEDTCCTWQSVADALEPILEEETTGGTLHEILASFLKQFNVTDPEVLKYFQGMDAGSPADIADLTKLAFLCNDGHGLVTVATEGSWFGFRSRLGAFGGDSVYITRDLAVFESTPQVNQKAAELAQALEADDLHKAAQLIKDEARKKVEQIKDENKRKAIKAMLSF